jgi:hypothetical protein
LATAIRSSELVLALDKIARQEIANAERKAEDDKPRLCPSTLTVLRELFEDKVDPGSPALEAKAQELIGRLTAKIGEDKVPELRAAVLQTFGKTSEIVTRVDAWFETVMDRTSERFKVLSRYVTVGVALIFGLVLQIDSVELYQRLSTDEALRGRLLSMADEVSDDAQDLMNAPDLASRTIGELAAEQRFAAVKEKLGEVPKNLQTREDGEQWLTGKLAEGAERDEFVGAYRARYPQTVQTRVGELQKTLTGLETKVKTTVPGLIPDLPTLKKYGDPLAVFGMLMTVAFLSLGAPFWFNALRSLSALKPVVSQKLVEEEKKTV